MYDTILFDLDGTLTDSGLGITKAVQYALGQLGYAVPPREELFSFIGPPLHKSFQRHCGVDEAGAVEAVRQFRVYYNEMGGILENEVYPGIRELLRDLKAAGKRLMIATSKPQAAAEKVMHHFGLDEFVPEIIGGTDDPERIFPIARAEAPCPAVSYSRAECHPARAGRPAAVLAPAGIAARPGCWDTGTGSIRCRVDSAAGDMISLVH